MDTLDINCQLNMVDWHSMTITQAHDYNTRVSKTAVYGYPRHSLSALGLAQESITLGCLKLVSMDTLDINCQLKR